MTIPRITIRTHSFFFFFFFNDTATTEIYTLSLHDALPIRPEYQARIQDQPGSRVSARAPSADRKSTRLNSSHVETSYAVSCLKKKKNNPAGAVTVWQAILHCHRPERRTAA